MDVKEFKAWFDGFCENIETTPTPEQWAKIKAKIHGLDVGSKPVYREPAIPRWSWEPVRGLKPLSAAERYEAAMADAIAGSYGSVNGQAVGPEGQHKVED